jgi:hypothetical protein
MVEREDAVRASQADNQRMLSRSYQIWSSYSKEAKLQNGLQPCYVQLRNILVRAPAFLVNGFTQHSGSSQLTELPHQNPSRIKTRETRLYYQNKMRDKYAKSKAIDEAVAAIKRGEFIHYSDAAKKYKCDRSALSRRVCGLTKTKKDADSFWR